MTPPLTRAEAASGAVTWFEAGGPELPVTATPTFSTPGLPPTSGAYSGAGVPPALVSGLTPSTSAGALSSAAPPAGPAVAPKDGAIFARPADSRRQSTTATRFELGGRAVTNGQEIWLPLPAGRMHVVELRYADTRRIGDLLLAARPKGGGAPFAPMKAESVWPNRHAYDLKTNEKNEPWIENPLKVQVDVIYPEGYTEHGRPKTVHNIGKKFVDPHLKDAWDVNHPGTPETDNVYEGNGQQLPDGELPRGCWLRLTLVRANTQPWETTGAPMTISYVQPQTLPRHGERRTVYTAARTDAGAIDFEGQTYVAPPPGGFRLGLTPGRKVAAILVQWTDQGSPDSGFARWRTADGQTRSTPPTWIGSGETKLIPLDDTVPQDGVIDISGSPRIRVARIEVLYSKAP